MRLLSTVLGLAVALGLVGPARAGVTDTPLPTFSDGHAAQTVALVPGVIKSDAIETDVICTSLAPAAVDVGFEVFNQAGVRANRVSTGNGAILAVGPGAYKWVRPIPAPTNRRSSVGRGITRRTSGGTSG